MRGPELGDPGLPYNYTPFALLALMPTAKKRRWAGVLVGIAAAIKLTPGLSMLRQWVLFSALVLVLMLLRISTREAQERTLAEAPAAGAGF